MLIPYQYVKLIRPIQDPNLALSRELTYPNLAEPTRRRGDSAYNEPRLFIWVGIRNILQNEKPFVSAVIWKIEEVGYNNTPITIALWKSDYKWAERRNFNLLLLSGLRCSSRSLSFVVTCMLCKWCKHQSLTFEKQRFYIFPTARTNFSQEIYWTRTIQKVIWKMSGLWFFSSSLLSCKLIILSSSTLWDASQ